MRTSQKGPITLPPGKQPSGSPHCIGMPNPHYPSLAYKFCKSLAVWRSLISAPTARLWALWSNLARVQTPSDRGWCNQTVNGGTGAQTSAPLALALPLIKLSLRAAWTSMWEQTTCNLSSESKALLTQPGIYKKLPPTTAPASGVVQCLRLLVCSVRQAG